MADTQSTSPSPEDMHWGISYLRDDLQELRQDMRDFRKDVAAEFSNVRKEMALHARNNLMIMVGVTGIFASIIIAFIEYRLPGG